MATRFFLTLPDPARARGPVPALAFRASGADAFAEELASALRDPSYIERWRLMQDEPDEVDPALLAVDPGARVSGEQRDLKIDLVATTSLSGTILRHRLRMLAGPHWELRDVRAG